MAGLRVGQEVWIRCTVQPGPFSDEKLVTIETIGGPISGFVGIDELREGQAGNPWGVRGVIHNVTKTYIEAWINGSFFTTNGLTHVAPELAMAA